MRESGDNSRWRLRLALFFACVLIGLLGGAVAGALFPKFYRATVTVQLNPSQGGVVPDSIEGRKAMIWSRATLEPVIAQFDLNTKWGLDTEGSFRRLRRSIDITKDDMTHIAVLNRDPQLAADLANAIAESLRKVKLAEEQEQIGNMLAEMEAEVETQRREVERILNSQGASEDLMRAQKTLEELEFRFSSERMQRAMPRAPVVVWKRAEVPTTPASRAMRVTLPAGALIGAVVGAILAALVRRK